MHTRAAGKHAPLNGSGELKVGAASSTTAHQWPPAGINRTALGEAPTANEPASRSHLPGLRIHLG
jgi:hypothetical protein